MAEVIDATVVEEKPAQPVAQTGDQSVENQIIKIDDVDYRFGDLPKNVQDMILMLSRWNMELMDVRLQATKLEHALKSLTTEISKVMKATKADGKPAMEIRGAA